MFNIIKQSEVNEAIEEACMSLTPKEDKLRAYSKDLKNFKQSIQADWANIMADELEKENTVQADLESMRLRDVVRDCKRDFMRLFDGRLYKS